MLPREKGRKGRCSSKTAACTVCARNTMITCDNFELYVQKQKSFLPFIEVSAAKGKLWFNAVKSLFHCLFYCILSVCIAAHGGLELPQRANRVPSLQLWDASCSQPCCPCHPLLWALAAALSVGLVPCLSLGFCFFSKQMYDVSKCFSSIYLKSYDKKIQPTRVWYDCEGCEGSRF